MEIDALKAVPEADGVPHGWHAAIDRAGTDRDKDTTVLPEFRELPDVILVRASAFDEADIDRTVECLLVVEGRDVEIHEVRQFENALVDIEQ
jgi:hypothetical protein